MQEPCGGRWGQCCRWRWQADGAGKNTGQSMIPKTMNQNTARHAVWIKHKETPIDYKRAWENEPLTITNRNGIIWPRSGVLNRLLWQEWLLVENQVKPSSTLSVVRCQWEKQSEKEHKTENTKRLTKYQNTFITFWFYLHFTQGPKHFGKRVYFKGEWLCFTVPPLL